jgi:hypothetical protein
MEPSVVGGLQVLQHLMRCGAGQAVRHNNVVSLDLLHHSPYGQARSAEVLRTEGSIEHPIDRTIVLFSTDPEVSARKLRLRMVASGLAQPATDRARQSLFAYQIQRRWSSLKGFHHPDHSQ